MLACDLHAYALAGKPGRAVELLLTHMTIFLCLAPGALPLLHLSDKALALPCSGVRLWECNVSLPFAWGVWDIA